MDRFELSHNNTNLKEPKEYPESKAVKVWNQENLLFSIVQHPELQHYCGYVRFPKKPVREKGYEGILTYVSVHGGITFARQNTDGSMVYGFDCGHSGDWSPYHPEGHKWTLDEVKIETEKMAKAIIYAQSYEKRYLQSMTQKGKAKVIDEYHAKLKKKFGFSFVASDNFGTMINLLSGDL